MQIYENRLGKKLIPEVPSSHLVFDPGETTGWSFFIRGLLQQFGQINTSSPDTALEAFTPLIDRTLPIVVVIEEYRVYANRTEQHAGSSLSTPRLIGMLETLLLQRKIPWHKQPASGTKQFVTDDKLKAWNMWAKGEQHARDAIRHGIYFTLFPPKVYTSQAITKTRTVGRHVG